MRFRCGPLLLSTVLVVAPAEDLRAQSVAGAGQGTDPSGQPVVTSPVGPPTVRAVRAVEPMRVDGRLDERIYATTEPIVHFVQQEPDEGVPATEKTEAWVVFDD